MSVLIKGMEMPKNCPCELVGIGYDMYCSFVHGIPARVREYDECCEKKTRPDWCPLIEVPEPHGRLIDVDAADEYAYDELNIANSYLTGWEAARAMQKLYQNFPTVIPASEERK